MLPFFYLKIAYNKIDKNSRKQMTKEDMMIEEVCKNILQLIIDMAKSYPGLDKQNSSIREAYLIIKQLNKNNSSALFPIINTMRNKEGETNYVIHHQSKQKHILFDHTAKKTSPWFIIKQHDINFKYNGDTFFHLFQLYRGNKQQLLSLLQETKVELENTCHFFKGFKLSNQSHQMYVEKLTDSQIEKNNQIMEQHVFPYLNEDAKFAFLIHMDKEYVEKWATNLLMLYPCQNVQQKILQLYQEKISLIINEEIKKLLKKEKNNTSQLSGHIGDRSIYNEKKSLSYYKKRLHHKLDSCADLIEKISLYVNLNHDLEEKNEIKRNKL